MGTGRRGLTPHILDALRKGPAHHTELMELTRLNSRMLNMHMHGMLRVSNLYSIAAGEWFLNKKGEKDRIYKLTEREASKKTTIGMSPLLPGTDFKYRTKVRREKLTLVANIRKRLINEGNYNQEMESLLCEIYGVN